MTITAEIETVTERGELRPTEEEFRDDWDYKSEHSKIPVLSAIIRNHTLPPTANGTVSRY